MISNNLKISSVNRFLSENVLLFILILDYKVIEKISYGSIY